MSKRVEWLVLDLNQRPLCPCTALYQAELTSTRLWPACTRTCGDNTSVGVGVQCLGV